MESKAEDGREPGNPCDTSRWEETMPGRRPPALSKPRPVALLQEKRVFHCGVQGNHSLAGGVRGGKALSRFCPSPPCGAMGSAGCAWGSAHPGAAGTGQTFARSRDFAARGPCAPGTHLPGSRARRPGRPVSETHGPRCRVRACHAPMPDTVSTLPRHPPPIAATSPQLSAPHDTAHSAIEVISRKSCRGAGPVRGSGRPANASVNVISHLGQKSVVKPISPEFTNICHNRLSANDFLAVLTTVA